jgi:hypothetical protein
MRSLLLAVAISGLGLVPLAAQSHEHVEGMVQSPATTPVSPGQAAFGAIAEIVARLEADPMTDWSKVSLERLRQHLIDMDRVTLGSRIATIEIPGGFEADLTGEPETAAAIVRMTVAHAGQMSGEGGTQLTAVPIEGGARMRVVATDAADPRTVARLRGLGAIGVLALGNHHGPHHEALARGGDPHGGH